MIVVIGEALVDLVIAHDGSVDSALGGAPYNTARAAARLGADVQFVGALSHDRFGQLLRAQLVEDGVGVDRVARTSAPTTLAAAEIDAGGAAAYGFYFDGTSAPQVGPTAAGWAVESLGRNDMLFTGGLGLVLEPMARSVMSAIETVADESLVVIDVNCREAVIPDRMAYVERVGRAASRADVVKVSDEDLTYLTPTLGMSDAAAALIDAGARVVIVTAGSDRTTIVTADSIEEIDVPPARGAIVDTIGAGDTFAGGLLALLSATSTRRGDLSMERLADAVRVGHAAAGVVVTRRGADPPTRGELDIDWPR